MVLSGLEWYGVVWSNFKSHGKIPSGLEGFREVSRGFE